MSREGRGLPADLFWPCGACWPASPQSFQSTATLPFSSPHCALRQKPVQPSVVWTLPTTRTRGFLLGWPDSRIKRGSFRPTTSLPYPCSSPCQVDIASGWKAPSLPGSCDACVPTLREAELTAFCLGTPWNPAVFCRRCVCRSVHRGLSDSSVCPGHLLIHQEWSAAVLHELFGSEVMSSASL